MHLHVTWEPAFNKLIRIDFQMYGCLVIISMNYLINFFKIYVSTIYVEKVK